MRHIRFAPAMVEAIRSGHKTMTFRLTPREPGDYIVDESGHPIYEHVDTGVRIRVVRNFYVEDLVAYAERYFAEEGFESPSAFLDFVRNLYVTDDCPSGYANVFEVLKVG